MKIDANILILIAAVYLFTRKKQDSEPSTVLPQEQSQSAVSGGRRAIMPPNQILGIGRGWEITEVRAPDCNYLRNNLIV